MVKIYKIYFFLIIIKYYYIILLNYYNIKAPEGVKKPNMGNKNGRGRPSNVYLIKFRNNNKKHNINNPTKMMRNQKKMILFRLQTNQFYLYQKLQIKIKQFYNQIKKEMNRKYYLKKQNQTKLKQKLISIIQKE